MSESKLRVYNTLTKTKAPFEPLEPPRVGMYLCGPTVYAESHIGHMVGPVIFDTIKRYLTFCGYEVNWVVNITDVDDKLIAKSQQRGIPMSQIATEMTADYLANLRALGVDQINHLPRATDHIAEIIALIESLINKKVAYASGGDVFFDVTADPNYGQLSNRSVEAQQGEGGEAAARKRNAGDFALWKNARPGEPSWTSPWGEGRPGWHIECSAMAKAILGETFDIHGGGLDLMFPHHENELAQSSCCHGKPMAGVWMHNGLMRAGGESGKIGGKSDREQSSGKISRSEGAGGLDQLIAEHTGERLRFFLLRTHYRSTNVFGDEPLREAGVALESFYRFFDRFEAITGTSFYELPRDDVAADIGVPKDLLENFHTLHERFIDSMNDDFNTGGAIGVLFDSLRSLNRYLDAEKLSPGGKLEAVQRDSLEQAGGLLAIWSNVLGLFTKPPVGGGGGSDDSAELLDAAMKLLIELRKEARDRKDYATGDAIRNRLQSLGVSLLDSKNGTTWEKA